MTEAGSAASGLETMMDPLLRGSYFFGCTPIYLRSKEGERRFFEEWVEDLEDDDDEEKPIPPLQIVMFPDLVEKAWGWEKLLPIRAGIDWSDYSNYVKEYYKNNAPEYDTGSTLVAMAKRCLDKEIQLASIWKKLEPYTDVSLHRKNIISTSLIKECAHSFTLKEGVKSDPYIVAAFLCIEKEIDLILELLRCGARPNYCLIEESNEIRMCTLALMCHSDIAAGAMLGITKETSMICEWMNENQKLDILCLSLPDHIEEGRMMRCRTLEFMTSILIMPYTPATAVLKPVMEATDSIGDDASDKLNCQDRKKIIDADNSKKRKRIEEIKKEINEIHVEKAWGFSRLLPFNGSVKWSDYINYLCEYYKRNASVFLREVAANDPEVYPANGAGNFRAAALFCFKMEEYLLSEWRIQLSRAPDYIFSVNTIIESSLIRNRAHSSFGATAEEYCFFCHRFCVAILLVVDSLILLMFFRKCIALKADLMCELLRHGAKPTDDIIKQSSGIRLCALSLLSIKGDQSVLAAAAAMVGIAKETKTICDWVKKEKKLVKFSSSTPYELEWSCFIRIRSLDVMTTIVQKSSFPSKVSGRLNIFYWGS
ncbi:hypothetical protein EJB05_34732, partial [Eragrostis curvula]